MSGIVVIGPPEFRGSVLNLVGKQYQAPCEFDDTEAALQFHGSHCALIVGTGLGFFDAQRLVRHFGQGGTAKVVRVRLGETRIEGDGDPCEAQLNITTCSPEELSDVLRQIGP